MEKEAENRLPNKNVSQARSWSPLSDQPHSSGYAALTVTAKWLQEELWVREWEGRNTRLVDEFGVDDSATVGLDIK